MSKVQQVSKLDKDTYLFICRDGEKTPPLRQKYLFEHLDYIEANHENYRVAGPMKTDTDGDFLGSVFLIAATSQEEAWEIMRGDPYISSDMYQKIECMHITPACGSWMGGIIWDQDEIHKNAAKYS